MSTELLEEVREWKLEAKLEDSSRYFFHTNEITRIENGSRSYVIGRKGSGKTAICEYLSKSIGPQRFAKKLTFKNFPFNELYELSDNKFTSPNQYITLWKYIIYSTIAKLMIPNQAVDPEIRRKLDSVYQNDPITSLPRTITHWTDKKFDFKILGNGVGGGAKKESAPNETPWIERVDILEQLIYQHIDKSQYFIVFDELDEDYKFILEKERHEQYNALITSLFKAVQDIKSIFCSKECGIRPVIFLRDDIYELLRDPDKTKWYDLMINLDWTKEKIKNLLRFRISRASDPQGEILSFNDAWNLLFTNQPVPYGFRQQKRLSSFDFITRSTMIRPRDYVRYLQDCASSSLEQNHEIIAPRTIVKADKAFSNYMRSELEDELGGVLPEIHEIFNILSHMRQQTFLVSDFKKAYGSAMKSGDLPQRPMDFVVTALFHFSVLGNQPKQKNIQVFRYLTKEARFNVGEKVCIHRGLYKSLQIL